MFNWEEVTYTAVTAPTKNKYLFDGLHYILGKTAVQQSFLVI